MCGIAGSINYKLNIPVLTEALYHRGPDEQATLEEDNVILHHHRLAILDITGGRQPMHYKHLTIIFNGQIYNHQDIRKKYQLDCVTNSDTETILQAYDKVGKECLNDFDGMFAFVIFDREKKTLFVARDRAGKKPLYYYNHGSKFVFASELNALRSQLDLSINDTAISQYLSAAYIFSSSTPYQHVQELPAGHLMTVSTTDTAVMVSRWWGIGPFYNQHNKDSFSTVLEKTDQLLHTAVKRRIDSSDLEVGSFLSGGIDSGLVTAIASNYNNKLKTFTVSFQGEYDEAPLARMVAERYKTEHNEIRISFDHLKDDVEKILFNYGEPFFDSSAIPSYYVSQAAKKHLTVILNGDGGDEIFGGYRRYVPFSKYDFFGKSLLLKPSATLLKKVLPVSHDKKSKYNYLYRLVDFASKKGVHVYFSTCLDVFEGYQQYLNNPENSIENIKSDFDRITSSPLSGLQKLLHLDFDHILASNLLVKMDIATMAHSLEGRSPLLSKEIVEYIPGINDKFKIKGKQTKYLLRKLAEKYLPSELIHQPKRGFEIPLKKWMDGELKDMIASYILSPGAYSRNFTKPNFAQQLWDRKIKTGDEKRAKMLWTLFALDVWHQKCYLRK